MGYAEFADLIIKELGKNNLKIISAVGTGSSSGGLGTYLKNKNVDFSLYGIQPFGSISFGGEKIIDPGFVIAGIGSGIVCQNIKHNYYDKIHWVCDEYSRSGCVELMKRHGVFAGLSSGACYLVANRESIENDNNPILFIAPDTGHRYVESVYKNHMDYKNIDELKPKIIHTTDELSLPWSEMNWQRRNYQELQKDLA